MAGCLKLEMIFYIFDLYKIELLPENLINKKYNYKHEMLYSKVMKQLKTYGLNTVFIVSLECLEYGCYEFGGFGEFGGIITPCISINNITSTSYEILCLINHKLDILSNRWCWPYGGVL